jgi:hypothetical protein
MHEDLPHYKVRGLLTSRCQTQDSLIAPAHGAVVTLERAPESEIAKLAITIISQASELFTFWLAL